MWSCDVSISFHVQLFQSGYKQILNNLIKRRKYNRKKDDIGQGNEFNKKRQKCKEGWAIGKEMH